MLPLAPLATIGTVLLNEGNKVKILDLRVSKFPIKDVTRAIKEFSPEYVGMTFTTPLFPEASKLASYIKKLKKDVIMISGGPHTSAMPIDTLKESEFDIAVFGEGEETIKEISQGKKLNQIEGIAYKIKNAVKMNKPRKLILDLDSLPMPAWHLFDLKKYKTPRISCRQNPVGPLETSRGCVYGCVYCSKCTFGRRFRKKSVGRVIAEIEHMLKAGFKEIHVLDDMFSTDIERAKKICDEIIRRKIKFHWTLINGIRVDRVDEELLTKLKKAGCYRLAFGVESGDSNVLNIIDKKIKLPEIKRAFKIANKVGMETIAFCMLGLPGDTKESMQRTIDLMKEVKPTLPKVSILLPLPATPLFNEWDKQGLILTKNWEDYSFHSTARVYKHPNLTDEEIYVYYKKFWKEILLSPEFLARRIIRDIKTGELFWDAYYFLKTLKLGW